MGLYWGFFFSCKMVEMQIQGILRLRFTCLLSSSVICQGLFCRLVVHERCSSYKDAYIFVSLEKSDQKLFTVDSMSMADK